MFRENASHSQAPTEGKGLGVLYFQKHASLPPEYAPSVLRPFRLLQSCLPLLPQAYAGRRSASGISCLPDRIHGHAALRAPKALSAHPWPARGGKFLPSQDKSVCIHDRFLYQQLCFPCEQRKQLSLNGVIISSKFPQLNSYFLYCGSSKSRTVIMAELLPH